MIVGADVQNVGQTAIAVTGTACIAEGLGLKRAPPKYQRSEEFASRKVCTSLRRASFEVGRRLSVPYRSSLFIKQKIYKKKIRSVQTAGGDHRIPQGELDRLLFRTRGATEKERKQVIRRVSGRNQLKFWPRAEYERTLRRSRSSLRRFHAVALPSRQEPIRAGFTSCCRAGDTRSSSPTRAQSRLSLRTRRDVTSRGRTVPGGRLRLQNRAGGCASRRSAKLSFLEWRGHPHDHQTRVDRYAMYAHAFCSDAVQ